MKWKLYPDEEPSFNGTYYLCIISYLNTYSYSFVYFNDQAEFKPTEKGAIVVAFTETDPKTIIQEL